jgi:hypothetical protein
MLCFLACVILLMSLSALRCMLWQAETLACTSNADVVIALGRLKERCLSYAHSPESSLCTFA